MSTAEALELQRLIRATIPLSEAMGYRITELSDTRIRVEAPPEPNINIHGTGFAGSLYALGILTAWGLCSHVVTAAGLDAELVVAEANIRYRAPVRGVAQVDIQGEFNPGIRIRDVSERGEFRERVVGQQHPIFQLFQPAQPFAPKGSQPAVPPPQVFPVSSTLD